MDDSQTAKLTKVIHISGDVVIVKKTAVTREWQLVNNFGDYEAQFELPPMKPTPVHDFFREAKSGPYRFTKMTGEKKAFKDLLLQTKESVVKNAKADTAAVALTLEAELTQVQAERRRKSLADARAKAKAMAGKAKSRRTLSLQKSDA